MHHSLLDPLVRLLGQSQSLLQMGMDEDWEGLQRGVADYQKNMEILADLDYLQALKNANQTQDALNFISQIQLLHKELDELTLMSHDKVASELRQIMQADKAMEAYRR